MVSVQEQVEEAKGILNEAMQHNLFEIGPEDRKFIRADLEKFLKQHGVKSYTIEDRNGHLEVRLWWK